MTTSPTAFEWSFERSPCDANSRYTTFSVGVFQWLPKASGNGCKKSRTIRVIGYVSAPFDVYQKATELCGRLNRETVMWDQPPAWLQSQYSVPRPETEPPPFKPKSAVDARRFRQIRKRVFQELLAPLGYDVSSTVSAKLDNGVIRHVIDIQFGTFSSTYMINFGQHFSGLPSFFGVIYPDRRQEVAFACDCLLHARLDCPEARGQMDYGDSPGKAEAKFRWLIQACLDELEKLRQAHPDIQTMLRQYPPERLLDDQRPDCFPSFDPMRLGGLLAIHTSQAGDRQVCRRYIQACKTYIGKPDRAWRADVIAKLDRLEANLAPEKPSRKTERKP